MMSSANGTDGITVPLLRQALKRWHRTDLLARHPLAGLALVEARRRAAGYAPGGAGRGAALQLLLQEAIHTFRPDEGPARPHEKRWRAYLILREQYLEGRAFGYVAARLGIARRTYFGEQRGALERLAAELARRERRQGRPAAAAATPIFLAPPRPAQPLVGRRGLLEALRGRLLAPEAGAVALHGLPGVGKSAVAIALAHDPALLARYPDGVLWAALGPAGAPAGVLAEWGEILALDPALWRDHPDPDALARRIHGAIGMRAMLLIVDDAWQVDHALALRLGGPSCGHLLTCRRPGIALPFAGAGAVRLPELGEADAIQLLDSFDPQLAVQEPERLQAVARAMGGLPLALTLAGSYLRGENLGGQPARLRAALERLVQEPARLHLAPPHTPFDRNAGLTRSLAGTIRVSEEALDPAARAALHTVAHFAPKPHTFSAAAARAIAGVQQAALDSLVDHGLLEPQGSRLALHQSIAVYARARADEGTTRRFVSGHLTRTLRHADRPERLAAALPHLLRAMREAQRLGMRAELARLANVLYPLLAARGHAGRAEEALQTVLERPPAALAPAERVQCWRNLGRAAAQQGRLTGAARALQHALALASEPGMEGSVAELLANLGALALARGRLERAAGYLQEGLQMAPAATHRDTRCALLANLGQLAAMTGRPGAAEAYLREGLVVARAGAGHGRVGEMLLALGTLALTRGRYGSATRYLQEALALALEVGAPPLEVAARINLGAVAWATGQGRVADDAWATAAQAAAVAGLEDLEARAMVARAEGALAHGETGRAATWLSRAAHLAASHGRPEVAMGVARVQARLAAAGGAFAEALDHLEQAEAAAARAPRPAGLARLALDWGEVLLAAGQVGPAGERFVQAERRAAAAGAVAEEALARDGQGRVMARLGQTAEGAALRQEARQRLKRIGHRLEPDARDLV